MMNDERQNSQSETELMAAQVFAVVRQIPRGHVMSYGRVGAACEPPISGYVCGRILAGAQNDVPWWRVVGKDGGLPIRKRNPNLMREQRERLESEGVGFDEDGKVRAEFFSATIGLFDTRV